MRARAVAVDVLLAAATFVVIVAAMTAGVGEERPADVLAYLWALGIAALLLLRRRHPVLVLALTAVAVIGYHVAGYPAIGVAVPSAAALYSAAEAGRVRAAVGAAFALLTVAWSYRALAGQDLAYLFGVELALSLAVMGAAIALGDGAASRLALRREQQERLHQAELEHRNEVARRLEEERIALARDLHDVVAHTVTVISMQSDLATEAFDDDPAVAREALRTIRGVAATAMRELRSTVELLRTRTDAAPREPASGLEHLPLLTSAAQATGLQVSIKVDGEPRQVPAAVDTTAYRIVQEALTNTIRHVDATRADVRISYCADALEIEIHDDGPGTQPTPSTGGQGLRGMRERVAVIGGCLEAGAAQDGVGFRLRARLPVAGP